MQSQNEYIVKMKAKLDQLDTEIDLWKAKVNKSKAEVKIKYQQKVAELKEERKEAGVWLDNASDTSADAWESVKGGFEEAYEKIKRAFSQRDTD